MKKIRMSYLLLMLLLVGMTACGKETPEASDSTESVAVSSETDGSSVQSSESSATEESSFEEIELPGLSPYLAGTYTTTALEKEKKILVDVPAYKYIEKGYTAVFLDDGVKLVTLPVCSTMNPLLHRRDLICVGLQ